MEQGTRFPEAYQRDIRRAVEILREGGCARVFLFGSLATARDEDGSDIDLAISGCPKGKFFHLLGKLLLELEHPVDLIDLDGQDAFARYIEKEGELVQIG